MQTSMPHPNIWTSYYKTFVRPHLDYGDIKYGKVYNSSIIVYNLSNITHA